MTTQHAHNCRTLRWLQALRLIVAMSLVQVFFAFTALAGDPITSAAEIDYPPFSIVTDDGRVDGFSVELLRAALKAMNRDVTFRTGIWPDVRTLLETGEIQALPVVGRTPEREALFDFTFPYMSLHGAIVVRDDSDDVRTLEDLRGRRVAVMKGDNAEEFLRRTDRGINLFTTGTFEQALQALHAGNYDAVVMQRLVALRLLQETGLNTTLRVIDRPIDDFRQDFSFAVKDGDRATLALLNEGLALVIADGTYQRLHAKWFAALQLPARKRLIVGGDANFTPYEYLDKQGTPTGFITELIRAIALETGLDIDIRLGPWDQVVKQLADGDIDIIQGMFYSPKRNQQFDFGTSHLVTHYVSAVLQGGLAAPESYAELAGLRLVAQRGDVIVEELQSRGLTAQLTLVDSQEEALRQLIDGQHDCALVARLPALALFEKNNWTSVQLGRESLLERNYAYAVKKGQQALLAKLNEGLRALQTNGEYRRIHDKWLAHYQQPHSLWVAIRYSAIIMIPLVLTLFVIFLWSWSLRRRVAFQTSQIREDQLRLQVITDTAQDAILMINQKGAVAFANPAIRQVFGYEPDAILGRDFHSLLHSEEFAEKNHKAVALAKKKESAAGSATVVELTTRHKDGHEISVELSLGQVLLKEGIHEVGVLRDITERKQAQDLLKQQKAQLEQRNRALKQFNYAVSHELKTPLVSIESSLGLIQSSLPETTDPELATAFGYARTATRQMNNLLESLLVMFRINSEDSSTEKITLRKLIQDAIDQLTKGNKLEGIRLTIADEGPELCGDRSKLVQIWMHLIGNAAKYMGDQKHPAIDIGAAQIDQEIQFFVRDNGKGIEKSYQDKIFGLFDRFDKTSDGTGLGLPLVKRIVEYCGGTIRVESAGTGQGTCFYFTLPDVLINKGTTT